MRIEVLVNFGGVETGEKRILPGMYEHTDPRLFGCAEILVEMGNARLLSNNGQPILDKGAAAMVFALLKDNALGSVDHVSVPLAEPEENESSEPDPDAKVVETSVHGLGFNALALKGLEDAGIQTLEQIAAMSDEELLAIEGVTRASLKKMRAQIQE